MPVYGSILYHYWNFNVECWRNFEIGVMGRSKSLEMAPFDRSIAYQFIFHCNYGRRILYRFRNNGRYWSKTTFFHTPVPRAGPSMRGALGNSLPSLLFPSSSSPSPSSPLPSLPLRSRTPLMQLGVLGSDGFLTRT